MFARHRRVRQALTVALLVISVFAAPAAAQTSDGPADGSGNDTGTFDGTSDTSGGDGADQGCCSPDTATGTGGGSGDGTGTFDGTGGTGDGSGDSTGTFDDTGGTNGGSATDPGCCGPDTGTGTGEVARPRTLVLEPGTGPPGSLVTVSGDGFGNCPAQLDDVRPGAVEITWDGSSLATVDVARGRFSAGIQVPDAASPSTAIVAGACVGDPEVTASAEFTVTAPDPTTDPAQTTGDTAANPGGTTPATGADADSPSPTAGDAGEAGPTPHQAVDATEAASRTDGGLPAAQIATLLVVLGATAALLSRAARRGRGPAWAAAHVAAVPGTTTHGAVTVAPPPEGSPEDSIVRIEPRSGTVTHVLQEVDR